MFKIALCQITGTADKELNRAKAEKHVREAAVEGAQIVCLPEMWNCPYSNDYFRKFAEPADGPSVKLMSDLASELGITIIGGSIAELEEDRVYNTSFCFGPDGNIIGKHRKVHLFDIDVDGKFRFMESDTLTAGDSQTVFDVSVSGTEGLEKCRIGVAICYDVRFPEWFRKMVLDGVQLVFLPAAFNTTTGPVHWDLTMRARAVDNQIYFAANAPARDDNGIFKAYGNSCIANPWGDFIAHADEKECIIYGDVDLEYEKQIRRQLPLLKHRREELY
ncbi:MAG: carbon-nitrogen hydrolase family protein [Firmicutes bacterium]|nr:carbon-nitrogen hydrolase family protein [Bacillota bacterium]